MLEIIHWTIQCKGGDRVSRKKLNSQFNVSLRGNMDTYYDYFMMLLNISLSMFEWKNLPMTIDERFLELTLFEDGKVAFFKDEVMGFLCLQFTTSGKLDVQRNPVNIQAFGINGYINDLNRGEYVPIWNNYTRSNCVNRVYTYANRLWTYDRIIDVNINAQKTPSLVKGNKNQRLTLLNLYKEWDGNQPVIFGDDSLNSDALGVLKTDAPFIADKVYEMKTKVWNECLAFLGVGNLSVNKKERLLASEVGQSIVGTVAQRFTRLGQRQKACEYINQMFGLDVWCDYRFDEIEMRDFLEDVTGGEVVVGE